MRLQEKLPRFFVGGNALKKSQDVASLIGDPLVKQGRREQRIHLYYLLQEGRDSAHGVPDEGRQLGKVLSLLTERIEGVVTLAGIFECIDVLYDHVLGLIRYRLVVQKRLLRRLACALASSIDLL